MCPQLKQDRHCRYFTCFLFVPIGVVILRNVVITVTILSLMKTMGTITVSATVT